MCQAHAHAPPALGQETKYATQSYWEERYVQLVNNTTSLEDVGFEWFLSYDAMRPLLQALIRKRDTAILDIGCGTSSLLADLRHNGHTGRLVGIDYAASAIEALRRAIGDVEVELKCLNILDMDFEDQSFEVVVDKGTIDAIMCGDRHTVTRACSQIGRVLKAGGRFVLCSHYAVSENYIAQDSWLTPVLEGLLDSSHEFLWSLAVHVLSLDESPSVYVFTKARVSPRRTDDCLDIVVEFHRHF